jgi:hypothetical protein
MSEPTKEPEDIIANALYLLQLCQQDINMGRWVTVWPRAMKARLLCCNLQDIAWEKTADIAKKRKPPRKRTKGLTPS